MPRLPVGGAGLGYSPGALRATVCGGAEDPAGTARVPCAQRVESRSVVAVKTTTGENDMDAMGYDGPIIDGQLHELGPRSSGEVADVAIQRRLMAEVSLSAMDALGIDGALLHPTSAAWARELFDEFPTRFRSIPVVRPGAAAESQVESAYQQPEIAGVRAVIGHPPTGEGVAQLQAGEWDTIFDACERLDFPLFVFISGFLPSLRPALDARPSLRVVIDHVGIRQPPIDVRSADPLDTLNQLLSLAEYPNTYVKLCGLPALSHNRYPYRDVQPALESILEAYGAHRAFWASDIARFQGRVAWDHTNPRALGPYPGKHTYEESLAFIRDNQHLDDATKRLLLHDTITTLLGWEILESSASEADG